METRSTAFSKDVLKQQLYAAARAYSGKLPPTCGMRMTGLLNCGAWARAVELQCVHHNPPCRFHANNAPPPIW